MKISPGDIDGGYVVDIEPIADPRGFFARVWSRSEFASVGLTATWPQSNMQFSPAAGTLRGLHYQADPFGEIKLVRCTAGATFDVAADLRPTSPTYLRWMGVELTAGNHRMVWIPEGCAHGFLTLEPNTEVYYLTSAEYEPSAVRGVRYDDPALGIAWPEEVSVVAERDLAWPLLSQADFTDRTQGGGEGG